MNIRRIADGLSIPQTQVFENVTGTLAMRKVCVKFAPQVLSEGLKSNWKVIYQDLHHVNEAPELLDNVRRLRRLLGQARDYRVAERTFDLELRRLFQIYYPSEESFEQLSQKFEDRLNKAARLGIVLPPTSPEDFGKRNMPGKRARRHFSQLSQFERGLIIGMKTAGWSTRRVAGQVDRSECTVRNCWELWTREGTHARKTGSGATRKTTRREDRRIVRQALVDPTVTRSKIRADVGVAIVPQTISRHLAEANLKSKCPFRALPLTPEHQQLRLQWCQARLMWNVTD
ncbi:uncharacterized protein TNCV_5099461 [Trichonephila clavipes]|uniref:Transposase Tc1-like domain-containing protein n=1 Tax=Trichonephila clavipes TaxID=2585209 RepID=A0A8X6S036_TRICX|nr:uncharacterized protein TNCV_5099461 [Trichonephila clavipes]